MDLFQDWRVSAAGCVVLFVFLVQWQMISKRNERIEMHDRFQPYEECVMDHGRVDVRCLDILMEI